jgi:hypothetical protein
MSVPSYGTIQPPGPVTVADGATPTFTITPMTGFTVDVAKVDGTTVPVTDNHDGTFTYTFLPVHGNHALVVTVMANANM